MIKNHIRFKLLLILLLGGSLNLFGQKSYVTPSGQFININKNQNWEYIEKPEMLIDNNIPQNELSEYNELLQSIYYEEAKYYTNYIIFNFQLDQKNTLSKEDREIEKDLITKYKKAGIIVKLLKSLPGLDQSERQSVMEKINWEYQDFESPRKNEFQNHNEHISEPTSSLKESKNEEKKPEINNETIIEEGEEDLVDPNITKNSMDQPIGENKLDFQADTRSYTEILKETNCNLIYNGFDTILNANRKETGLGLLFNYTHPKLIRHFKNGNFLVGKASMIESNEKYYLNLEISIKSKDARRSYGYIDKNAMLRITLLSGRNIFLTNRILSEGKLESYTGYTLYNCFFSLKKEDVVDLENLEVDKIGIMWTTGFEEYPIFQIDYLQNLIYCLKHEDKN